MRRLFFCVAFVMTGALLLVSCKSAIDRKLDEIEQIISSDPLSAYKQISSLDRDQLTSPSRRARYALLMSLSMDKAYVDVTNDSLIQIAVQYYEGRGRKKYRMLAYYSLGRVRANAEDLPGAMISFLQARDLAEDASDYHYVGLSCRNIAALFEKCHDVDSELRYYKQSQEAFYRIGESNYAAYSQFGEAKAYMAKGLYRTADSILHIVAEYARESSDKSLLAYALMNSTYGAVTSGSAPPDEVLSSYREMDALGVRKKTTVDYRILARVFDRLNVADSVSHYISMAEQSATTSLDSLQLYNLLSELYNSRGDYAAANKQMKNALAVHNRMVYRQENLQLANAISAHSRQEAAYHSARARYRLVLLILSIVTFIALLSTLIMVVVDRKRQLREKERIIRERERKIEEDLALIQEISEELHRTRNNQSEMAKSINELIEEKVAIVKMCADAYEAARKAPKKTAKDPYRYLDEVPKVYKTDQMQSFLDALDGFRKDESLYPLLENSVNKWRDGLMVKLRGACSESTMQKPQFSEDDFRILLLLYAGIPDRTVAFLMDMSCSAVRTRKTRYKERLLREDIPGGRYFVEELVRL